MSCADHHAALAGPLRPARVPAAVVLRALEAVHAGDLRQVRHAGHAGRHHQVLRAQRDRLSVAKELDDPLPRGLIVARAAAFGARPVVQLHDLGVHLKPVTDLVLGREHRPMVGERQVRQVVVPDRVVQTERLVAVAPGVAGPVVLVDDDRRHAEPPQPGAEADAALPAADHEHVGLHGVAQLGFLLRPALRPALATQRTAMLGALLARRAPAFLMAFQLGDRGQQHPALAVAKAEVPAAAGRLRLEADPRLDHAVGAARLPLDRPTARPGARQRVAQHGGDGVPPLERHDVPAERHQIPPEAGLGELRGRRLGVAPRQGVVEPGKPECRLLRRRLVEHARIPHSHSYGSQAIEGPLR